eukprot:COSAG06_NODE_2978_length_5994_cov_51.043766_5_plen_432_part_00
MSAAAEEGVPPADAAAGGADGAAAAAHEPEPQPQDDAQTVNYQAVSQSASARDARRDPMRWVPDGEASYCMIEGCSLEFWPKWPSDKWRRHHCRSCGWVVCKGCLAPEPVELDRWVSSKAGHPINYGAPTKAVAVCRACAVAAPAEVSRRLQSDSPQPQDAAQPPQAAAAAAAAASGAAAARATDGLGSPAPAPAPAPEGGDDDEALAAEYTRDGISLDGLLHVIRLFEGQLPEGATTSELCQRHIKPLTVAPGWVDEPQLIELDDQGNDVSAKEWYKHVYSRQSSSSEGGGGGGGGGATIRQVEAPPGTRSICRLLAADAATARFVGKPTHFLSHAWLYRILDVAGALESFVSSLPAGSRERTFFWFDCFSLDQVSTRVRCHLAVLLLLWPSGTADPLAMLVVRSTPRAPRGASGGARPSCGPSAAWATL